MPSKTKKSRLHKDPEKGSKGRLLKRGLIALVVLAVLALAAGAGWREYRHIRQQRMIERGRALIEAKDLGQASLAVQRALQLNPRDVVANRMMAELAGAAGVKQELYWRRSVAQLEPAVDENHLVLADTALRFNEVATAAEALTKVTEAGKKTAAYHDLAGRIAQAQNQVADAESHFAEAAKLEPANESYQLHLATVRLQSTDPEVRKQARPIVERFVEDPKFHRPASRALLAEAVVAKDPEKALAAAKTLQGTPGAPFEDRMLYLGLLKRFQRPEFYSVLSELQERSLGNPEDVGALLSWMSGNSMALVAADWSKRLPEDLRAKMPVPAAIGECFAILNDWEALRPLVVDTNWEYADFLRLAFLARVQREDGDALGSTNSWSAALKGASSQAESLIMVARFATSWGWENETNDLFWVVARSSANQQWALNNLFQGYVEKGNTHGLLNVNTRMLELDPKNLLAKNNVVLLSLLLGSNMEKSMTLAAEAHAQDKANPGVTSTYAFALHLQGKTAEGLQLLRTLEPEKLADPSYAAYYGLLLADGGTRDEARKYLEIAKGGKLLPEEQSLVAKALERLKRR